jgi:hypothetical protein
MLAMKEIPDFGNNWLMYGRGYSARERGSFPFPTFSSEKAVTAIRKEDRQIGLDTSASTPSARIKFPCPKTWIDLAPTEKKHYMIAAEKAASSTELGKLRLMEMCFHHYREHVLHILWTKLVA